MFGPSGHTMVALLLIRWRPRCASGYPVAGERNRRTRKGRRPRACGPVTWPDKLPRPTHIFVVIDATDGTPCRETSAPKTEGHTPPAPRGTAPLAWKPPRGGSQSALTPSQRLSSQSKESSGPISVRAIAGGMGSVSRSARSWGSCAASSLRV